MTDSNVIPLDQQNWRPIPDYEDTYEISDYGLIRRIRDGKNTKAGKILALNNDRLGYKRIQLWHDKKRIRQSFAVHRLVMLVFIGEPPEGREVNHKDGDKANNQLGNLEYITHQENIIHSFRELNRTVTVPRGEKSGNAKLTDEKIVEIRKRAAAGETRRAIAEDYGVSHVNITHIVNRKTWTHIEEAS